MNPKDRHVEFDTRLLQALGLSESSSNMVMEYITELRADEPNMDAVKTREINILVAENRTLIVELEERRKAMADIVRALGKGCDGMSHHEIAPIVKAVAEKLEKELKQADQHERELGKIIDEREAAEQAISQAYYLVIGNSPEWSNFFGHTEALEEIEAALRLLKSAAKEAAIVSEKEKKEGQEVHDYLVSVNPDNQHLSVLESCIQQRGIENRLRAELKQGATIYPLPLNMAHETAIETFAKDDRLWTTEETVRFNLRTFARVVLRASITNP